jgi:succinate-semialdehyde dehydrogenase/glutarate-semialdehyde dehydrogenase
MSATIHEFDKKKQDTPPMQHDVMTEEDGVTRSYDPATGELVGESRQDGMRELEEAMRMARIAQADWAKRPVAERAKYILRVRDYIVANADRLAQIISRDNGKTRTDALATELLPATMAATYYATHAEAFLEPKRLAPGNPLMANKVSTIHRVPFGVIAVFSPWNYPFAIPFAEVVMGLLAGNAVMLKVASETAMVGRALEEVFVASGLPEGIFTFLNLPVPMAGEAIFEVGIDKLFFTGSVRVGKLLMRNASDTLTPVSLELGGNDAMLVCEDADLDRAAAGATWAGFQNAGQSCAGVERVYVHEKVYDAFVQKFSERVEALRIGVPNAEHSFDIGSMTTARQVKTVEAHIADALEKGAKIKAQAKAPEQGCFANATLLVDVDHSMQVMQEETFGPVVAVMKVKSMQEAIEFANDSDLGLTGSVWTRDHKKGHRLASQIKAGVITINDHLMSHGLAETPWGGFKNSGIGRTHGEIGFDEMTQPQVVVDDILPGVKKNMWWHPHGPEVYDGLKGVMNVLYGASVKDRLGGTAALLKLFPRTFKK